MLKNFDRRPELGSLIGDFSAMEIDMIPFQLIVAWAAGCLVADWDLGTVWNYVGNWGTWLVIIYPENCRAFGMYNKDE